MTAERLVLKCLDPVKPTKEWALRAVVAAYGVSAHQLDEVLAELHLRDMIVFAPHEGWRLRANHQPRRAP